jgi:ubiquitin carboxyl-terminal hydrolase 7
VRKSQKVGDLAPTILEKMGWQAGTEFSLFEVSCKPFNLFFRGWLWLTLTMKEIKHTMVDPMKPKQTFQQSEIQDGDIITFQKVWKESEYVVSPL